MSAAAPTSMASTKEEVRAALDRIKYWNNTWKTTAPTGAAPIGMVIALILPTVLYNVLPAPSNPDVCSSIGRISLLVQLQVFVALIAFYYILVTGSIRVGVSPAAAHDPAAMYATNTMPMAVLGANRAFRNTLEQ